MLNKHSSLSYCQFNFWTNIVSLPNLKLSFWLLLNYLNILRNYHFFYYKRRFNYGILFKVWLKHIKSGKIPFEIILPPNFSFAKEVFEAIEISNSLQDSFLFQIMSEQENAQFNILNFEERVESEFILNAIVKIKRLIKGFHPNILLVTSAFLDGIDYSNIFADDLTRKNECVGILTIYDVPISIISLDKMASYFLYYFVKFALKYNVPKHDNHKDTLGCIYDQKLYRQDLKKSINARMFCGKCRKKMFEENYNLNDRILNGLNNILAAAGDILEGKNNSAYYLDAKRRQFDYVIITALEGDEMEALLNLNIFENEGSIQNDQHLIGYGYLKKNKTKKIAWVSQKTTGMVDASIVASEMITRHNPNFIIMPGVLGGRPIDTKIGDIIVATKVFTIDKGKLTNEEDFKHELEVANTGNVFTTLFERKKGSIINFIKENARRYPGNELTVHFGPLACVRHVIDREFYFKNQIIPIERKTIGLEMESYGIARACEIVNNGKTKAIIIKSVMDNTQDKEDWAKPYAAETSALFIQFILETNLI